MALRRILRTLRDGAIVGARMAEGRHDAALDLALGIDSGAARALDLAIGVALALSVANADPVADAAAPIGGRAFGVALAAVELRAGGIGIAMVAGADEALAALGVVVTALGAVPSLARRYLGRDADAQHAAIAWRRELAAGVAVWTIAVLDALQMAFGGLSGADVAGFAKIVGAGSRHVHRRRLFLAAAAPAYECERQGGEGSQ